MPKQPVAPQRREASLSRARIVEAAIALLDSAGETGLTFRALSERLATGPGAIYWHVANKGDLLVAACDQVIAGVVAAPSHAASPQQAIRTLALGLFDAMDAHPWIGATLLQSAGQLPTVRLFECLGRQVRALGVPPAAQWSAVSALLHYVLGVGGQNAANRLYAQTHAIERAGFLGEVAAAWAALDEAHYPFTRSMAPQLGAHDDRADFLAGIDLILAGLHAAASTQATRRAWG